MGDARLTAERPVTSAAATPAAIGSCQPRHGRRARWPAIFGLAAVIALTLAVRLARPTGWLGSDDAAYYSAAEHVLSGTPIQRLHHQYSRMAVILPVAASVAIFGHTPAATWLPMLLASVACVVLVALLGRCLFSWREGLLAAMIVALLPYFRILSTTAYPDVHACLWTTLAVLAVLVCRRSGEWRVGSGERIARISSSAGTAARSCLRDRQLALILCGFSIGLAVSAKLFAAPVAVAVAYVVWCSKEKPRVRIIDLATMAGGAAAFFVLEGLFYWHAAGDFFYTLHAHGQATGLESPTAGGTSVGIAAVAWDRLTMLFRSTTSGWGALGVLFWPVMLLAWFEPRTRALAVWGLATYLGVALTPVGFENGIKLNPLFHGRHILSASIPFALCLAWIVGRIVDWAPGMIFAARRSVGDARRPSFRRFDVSTFRLLAWPACFGIVLLLAYGDRHHLNGFVDRDTWRLGQGISAIIAATEFNDDGAVFVPPSIYWRYRILFPPHLRGRLRVVADERAPDWWKHVCPDMAERTAPLPPPGRDYLLATPRQLSGQVEHWDYGVSLPGERLLAWHNTPPLSSAVREAGSIRLLTSPHDPTHAVAILLGPGGERFETVTGLSKAGGRQTAALPASAPPQPGPPTDR